MSNQRNCAEKSTQRCKLIEVLQFILCHFINFNNYYSTHYFPRKSDHLFIERPKGQFNIIFPQGFFFITNVNFATEANISCTSLFQLFVAEKNFHTRATMNYGRYIIYHCRFVLISTIFVHLYG